MYGHDHPGNFLQLFRTTNTFRSHMVLHSWPTTRLMTREVHEVEHNMLDPMDF